MDLPEVLDAQAERVETSSDLHDVVRRARRLRRRRAVLRACGLLVLLGATATVAVRFATRDDRATVATEGVTSPVAFALIAGDVDAGRAVEYVDAGSGDAGWTVSVRRPDGALGRSGAVVTYPVGAPSSAAPVDLGGVTGWEVEGTVTWRLGSSHARVRGDLSREELLAIAVATSIERDRPVVADLPGLRVASAARPRAGVERTLRYGSAEVGEAGALGDGLVYTNVISGGGFEDELFATERTFLTVDAEHAVLSRVGGGNAALAWELPNGDVALVGYSGSELTDEARSALSRLASRAQAIDPDAWEALEPQRVERPR